MIRGGAAISWNWAEQSPTLRAETHQHLPVVVIADESSNKDKLRAIQND
jgi:hypothetical protein